jgi:hypothetical protein
MKQTDIARELTDIKKLLKEQGRTLKEMHGTQHVIPKKHHWKVMLAMAAFVLFVGGFGAYQYYRVLQSIIGQYPHNGVSRAPQD